MRTTRTTRRHGHVDPLEGVGDDEHLPPATEDAALATAIRAAVVVVEQRRHARKQEAPDARLRATATAGRPGPKGRGNPGVGERGFEIYTYFRQIIR